jgi:hypothetical protein
MELKPVVVAAAAAVVMARVLGGAYATCEAFCI